MTDNTLDFDDLRPPGAYITAEHDKWRQRVRKFVNEHIAPHIDTWEQSGSIPDAVFVAAADANIYGSGFPAELGGNGGNLDIYERIIFAEELHRLGSGVVFAELATHWIGLPPVIDLGSDTLREQVGRAVLAGRKRVAFAVTEPSGGSDVSRLKTTATKTDELWKVNGCKTLVSGGLRADYILTAVRTGDEGIRGISLLLIDGKSTGVRRTVVDGLSWYSGAIATIEFDDVEVPEDRLIGVENSGFTGLTNQFNVERFSGIASALALSRVCLSEALKFSRERTTFGQRLIDHQVIRHKLVDMIRTVRGTYSYLDHCVWRFNNGDMPVADLCMLKIQATEILEKCAREALHITGGSAYTGASRLERIFRESRIFALGGGTEEILKDLASRQLRF